MKNLLIILFFIPVVVFSQKKDYRSYDKAVSYFRDGEVEKAKKTWTKEVSKAVVLAVQTALDDGERDSSQISRQVRRATGQLVSERTGRRPVLIPVVEEA